MSGKPAARRDDMTLKGGPIIHGSLTVLIGSQGGIACSVCPGGKTEGSPVNPLLGAKVLPGETDVFFPGPLPFVVARDYSSYQTDTPAPVGLLGPGWWLPTEISLLQSGAVLTVNDGKGRSIRFESLAPGEAAYSRSENLWIVRGGQERLDEQGGSAIARLHMAWMGLHADDRRNSDFFFITNNPLGPWWVFGAPLASVSSSITPSSAVDDRRLPLLGLNDRFGKSLRVKRDAAGHMTAVQDGSGRQYRLELKTLPGVANGGTQGWGADSGVRLTAVYLSHDPNEAALPEHALARYEYNPRGELSAVHGRDGTQRRSFRYHSQLLGRMTAHAHAGRPPVTYTYNEQGKVVEQRRQGLPSFHFDYATDSTTVTDSLGRTRIYHLEGEAGLRRVVRLQHADGGITQSRFDGSGRMVADIDALGRETRYDLDVPTGALLSVTQPDGLQSSFNYNQQGQIVLSMDASGARDEYSYDFLGRISATTNALGHTTRYRYADDQSEQPSSIEDAKGGQKYLTWSTSDQLTSYTDCSGSVTRYHYDRWGQLTRTEGEEGTSQSSQYDLLGRIIANTNGLNQSTTYAYSEAGDLTRITAPDGNSVAFERDPQGRLTVYRYGGLMQQFAYDEAGRMIRLTNENGAHTSFEYDVMDRLRRQVNFDGRTQSYQHDAASQLIQSNDEGLISRYSYDKGGRLLRRHVGEHDNSPLENFEYSEHGRLAKAWHVTELGGNTITTEFQRDPLGRIILETQRIIGIDGTEVWQHSVERQFDQIGSESQTIYSGLPAVQWQTYGSGHLHGVVLDGPSVIDFERDKLHRETSRQFGPTQTTRSYDALSRLKHLHTHSPLIGEEAVQYTLNRQHHYDAAGQLVRIDTPGGPHEYGYDKAGRLIAASQPGLENQKYRFDPAGNRLFENQTPTTASSNWEETVRQHAQDQHFNLLGKNAAGDKNHTAPIWMDNRILDDGEFRYEYDRWGNTTRKYKIEGNEQHGYHYDSNHRLIRYTFESDDTTRGANYHYDVFGRRVVKQVQQGDADGNLPGVTETTWFGWDGDRLVLTEKDQKQIHTIYEPGSFVPMIRVEGKKAPARQTLTRKLQEQQGIPLDKKTEALFDGLEQELRQERLSVFSRQWMQQSGVMAQTLRGMLDSDPPIEGKQIHLYQCDHLGTPRALLNREGKIDWSIELEAWGQAAWEKNPLQLEQPIRFQGQHLDQENGLHYNRYRYYAANEGRYKNQDPIGFSGGLNFYRYTKSPIAHIDPLGLDIRLANTNAVNGWHRKVEVDTGTGGAYGISYGVYKDDPSIFQSPVGVPEFGGSGDGMVYVDNDPIIKTAESFETTPEEDAMLKSYMEKQVGKTGNYNVLFMSCRDYSKWQFERMKVIVRFNRLKNFFQGIFQ